MMEKVKMHSPNLTQKTSPVSASFSGCIEAQGEGGQLKLSVDFDQLRQELSESIVEGPQDATTNWPGSGSLAHRQRAHRQTCAPAEEAWILTPRRICLSRAIT